MELELREEVWAGTEFRSGSHRGAGGLKTAKFAKEESVRRGESKERASWGKKEKEDSENREKRKSCQGWGDQEHRTALKKCSEWRRGHRRGHDQGLKGPGALQEQF